MDIGRDKPFPRPLNIHTLNIAPWLQLKGVVLPLQYLVSLILVGPTIGQTHSTLIAVGKASTNAPIELACGIIAHLAWKCRQPDSRPLLQCLLLLSCRDILIIMA